MLLLVECLLEELQLQGPHLLLLLLLYKYYYDTS
jgi:hypothetical protein